MGNQYRVRTGTLVGVTVVAVDVEVDVGPGLPTFAIVGLPDIAVQEARERVRSALRASGFELPNARIVINLAPAPLRKHGTGFDLPIALGLLGATSQLPRELIDSVVAVGELSLGGDVRAVPGLIAHALHARERGFALLGPVDACGARALSGVEYLPLRRLTELRSGLPEVLAEPIGTDERLDHVDFREVVGQEIAVRALTVAAAGGHNVLMVGPPGSGKTMLARRLPTILPALTDEERLEAALVHSVAGQDPEPALSGVRPFRAPHHSATVAGLVGGGTPPRPGEVSLAHTGVLFLDEMPEFAPSTLQALRQPLEDGRITLVRAEGRVEFPARFALVGAANLCPCGFLGDPLKPCTCPPSVVERYRSRIGGPLMDRIDLVMPVHRPDPASLLVHKSGTESRALLDAVQRAREFASGRGGPASRMSGAALLSACRMADKTREAFEAAARRSHLSGRGFTRLLRVARTLADLDEAAAVRSEHISEAFSLRAEGR